MMKSVGSIISNSTTLLSQILPLLSSKSLHQVFLHIATKMSKRVLALFLSGVVLHLLASCCDESQQGYKVSIKGYEYYPDDIFLGDEESIKLWIFFEAENTTNTDKRFVFNKVSSSLYYRDTIQPFPFIRDIFIAKDSKAGWATMIILPLDRFGAKPLDNTKFINSLNNELNNSKVIIYDSTNTSKVDTFLLSGFGNFD